MAIPIQQIPSEALGKFAVASVKFIDGVGRWKIQLGSQRAGLFCFTDNVRLFDARVIVDEGLVRQKIRSPERASMFVFVGGFLGEFHGTPVADARLIRLNTRNPKSLEEVFFKFQDTGEPVKSFDFFYGDTEGNAWVFCPQ